VQFVHWPNEALHDFVGWFTEEIAMNTDLINKKVSKYEVQWN
jgi:hypothetical protein